jgi:transposase
LSSNIKEPSEALTVYRKRDVVENAFDDLKNHLDSKRLRIHSSSAMNSRLLIQFIALIYKSQIRKIAKNDSKINSLSISEIFDELCVLSQTTYKIDMVNFILKLLQKELKYLIALDLIGLQSDRLIFDFFFLMRFSIGSHELISKPKNS